MQWIARSEKDAATSTLERNLWLVADQFCTNSGLKFKASSCPILGLIFLRFAEARFAAHQRPIPPMPAFWVHTS